MTGAKLKEALRVLYKRAHFPKDNQDKKEFDILLYLSGLNMMEGILTKNNWLRFPPKPKEAKLNIIGGDLFWILPTRS